MNTASVLLENLIQGIQTLAWILLFTFTVIDPSTFTAFLSQQNATATTVLALAICYWFGIIVDTAYYHIFIQRYEQRWVTMLIPHGSPSLSKMVFQCIINGGELAKLLLERQAHLRMLRVSMVNLVFLTLSTLVFLNFRGVHREFVTNLTVLLLGAFLFCGTCFTWKKLYKYYVTIVQTSYELINQKQSGASAE
jgi:hypothetical protein